MKVVLVELGAGEGALLDFFAGRVVVVPGQADFGVGEGLCAEVIGFVAVGELGAVFTRVVIVEGDFVWDEAQVEEVGGGQVFAVVQAVVDCFGGVVAVALDDGVVVSQSLELVLAQLAVVELLALAGLFFQQTLPDLLVLVFVRIRIVFGFFLALGAGEDLSGRTFQLFALHALSSKLAGVYGDVLNSASGRYETGSNSHDVCGSDVVPIQIDSRYPLRDFSHRHLFLLHSSGLLSELGLICAVFLFRALLFRRRFGKSTTPSSIHDLTLSIITVLLALV